MLKKYNKISWKGTVGFTECYENAILSMNFKR